MSANERIEVGATDGASAGRRSAAVRPRVLRRVPPEPQVERIDGPDARLADAIQAAVRRIADRPVASVVLALGVGFVVGGALSFRAGRVALAAATRHIGRELLKEVL